MSIFTEAFSAGAGFSPESLRYLYQGMLGIVVFIWAGLLVKGFIQKAGGTENAPSYLIHHISTIFIVLVAFIAVSYW
jgi:hypothetical protein